MNIWSTDKASREAVRVTDHAVLRYLERGMGLNVEIVREHILQICTAPAAFGASCVRSEGLRFEIVNGRIITVTPDCVTPSRTARERNSYKMRRAREEAQS